MNTKQKRLGQLDKARDRIAGFDDLSGGGLPAVRLTLICGGEGSDKTLFAVTFLT
jgi:circadian clock protein KaiC